MAQAYILALEGGGSRSQAAVMDYEGRVLHISSSADVNTNFTAYQDAQQAVRQAVSMALELAQVPGEQVRLFVSALVGPRFGAELFGSQVPNADYRYYGEGDVVFAGAGIYRPHGVALVGSTGATAWGVRADDGRHLTMGGWGALLGDEGSAYAAGLLGLRAAVRSFEGREAPTALVDALCQHFGIQKAAFQPELSAWPIKNRSAGPRLLRWRCWLPAWPWMATPSPAGLSIRWPTTWPRSRCTPPGGSSARRRSSPWRRRVACSRPGPSFSNR